MPRKARITVPGHIHHIMSRGMEARSIFRSKVDRDILKSLIEKNIEKSGYLLYAWCFMDNHYHLVVRINNYPLAMFMRTINGSYAQYFRKRIKTRGYLFQARYKSIVCQDQNYLQELVRYVHLNPIRSGICKTIRSLRKYKWCGHSVLMGLQSWNIQNCSDVLKRFGKSLESSRINYEQFLKEALKKEEGYDFTTTIKALKKTNKELEDKKDTSCWVIGNNEYVKQVLNQQEKLKQRLTKAARENISIDRITEDVCKRLEIKKSEIFTKGRNNRKSRARKLVSYLAYRKYGIAVSLVAEYLDVTSPAVSNMLEEGERLYKDYFG